MAPSFEIFDGLSISSYFLVISLAFSVCLIWGFFRCPKFDVNPQRYLDLCLILMLGGFAGARLFHVLWEFPEHYFENPLDVLRIWQGGFVFYGGVIGAVLPGIFYWKRRGADFAPVLDLLAPVLPFGYAIGRFATLLSGSGYGRPTTMPWAIQYPQGSEAPYGVPLHPTPVYAVLWSLSVMVIVLVLENKKNQSSQGLGAPGARFFLLMVLHGVGRIVIEQFRNDYRGADVLGFTISTWMSLALVVLGALLFRSFRRSGPAH